MDEMLTELADLKRRLAEQSERIAQLERALESGAPGRSPSRAVSAPPDDAMPNDVALVGPGRRPDRRQLLRGAGLAAGVAATGAAAAVLDSTPAAAANGDPLLVGSATDATGGTALHYTGGALLGNALLSVSDTPFPPAGVNAAIWAWASNNATVGVRAQSTSSGGTGLSASAGTNGTGLTTTGLRAAMRLDGSSAAPPARSDAHTRGEIDIDVTGEVWLCVVSGTPGAWRKLCGPATAGAFHVLGSTNRIYDSRPGLAPLDVTKGAMAAGVERVVDATHGAAVPAGATAAVVNVTATDTTGTGFLALFRNGIAWPGNSNVNWSTAGVTVANLAVVALDTSARFKVRSDGSGGSTQFLVDVIGYYR